MSGPKIYSNLLKYFASLGVALYLLISPAIVSAAQMLPSNTYLFGIPPDQKGQSIDEIRELYTPMLNWLGEQVGCVFDFVGANTYEEMIDMVSRGRVQLAGLGPVLFIEAKQANSELRLLLTELKWNNERSEKVDYYRSYTLALKSRDDLNSLDDLKGKVYGFVDYHSTSGFQYPNALMCRQGKAPKEYFGTLYFLGSHPRVTDAIAAGSIDAGSTWDFNLAQARKKHGDIFKIIYSPPPIPNLTIVAHQSLPVEVQEKVIELLPTIDPTLLKGLPADGFTVRPESYYDSIKLIVEQQN